MSEDSIIPQETINRLQLCLSVSLLRYADLLQPDKLFYEAGLACKVNIAKNFFLRLS